MLVGYARTSTTDQQAGFDAHLVGLGTYGYERTFQEQVSAVASRGELYRAIVMLREVYKLLVTKLDRLARNVMDMAEILQQIEAKGAGLVILSLGSETYASSTTQGESDSRVCSISHRHPLFLSRSIRIVSSKVFIEDIRTRLYLHTLLDETLRFQRSVQQLALF